MANVLQYKTLADSTLNNGGNLGAADVSVTVTDGSKFPSLGDFYCIIESEIILVTARSGNVLTIVRAQEGTSAASHADGSDIIAVITALSVEGLFLRHTTDFRTTPLVAADFTAVNQGDSTLTEFNGGLVLTAPFAASPQMRMYEKTLPSAPYKITAMCWFWEGAGGIAATGGGIHLRDSSGGKITTIALRNSTTGQIQKWSNNTTQDASYASINAWRDLGKPAYIRIEDDTTNRIYSVSADGNSWTVIHTIGNTDYLTPDKYGIFQNADLTSGARLLTIWDLKVT